MEDDLKKIKMEDDLNLRQMEYDLINFKKKKKIKELFSIPLKFRGKPFLGLAQLSNIFLYYCFFNIFKMSSLVEWLEHWGKNVTTYKGQSLNPQHKHTSKLYFQVIG